MQRTALLLAVAACLAASAAAKTFPTFKNPGGPPFLDGPSYHWNQATQEVVTMGLTVNSSYSFAYAENGEIRTELGTYTSWECAVKPGSYLAVVELKVLDVEGNIIEEQTKCEYGFVYADTMRNTWSQSDSECPNDTTEVNRFLGMRPSTNLCGNPDPNYTEGDGNGVAAPAPSRRLRLL